MVLPPALRTSAESFQRWARREKLLGLALIVGAFAAVVFANLTAIAGGSDSTGYLNLARRLADGHTTTRIEALDTFDLSDDYARSFVPLGFIVGANGTSQPYHPPGLPLQMAALTGLLGSQTGPFLVPLVSGVLGLLAFYVLIRALGLSVQLALAGPSMLAVCPTYLFYSLQQMSDVVATCWVTVALAAALLARRQIGWMLLAGAAFGVSVLVRPTNALLLPALLIAMPMTPRGLLLLVAGGSPFALFNLAYNQVTYGGMFVTGYGGVGNLEVSWVYFPARFSHYTDWLTALLSPLVLGAAVLFPFDPHVPIRVRALLLAWFLPIFVFYCAYLHYDAWWYTRFLLPAMGALIVAALFVACDLLDRLRDAAWVWAPVLGADERQRVTRGVGVALLLVVLVTGVYRNGQLKVLAIDEEESAYRTACLTLADQAPEKSVVLAMQTSGALRYYTNAIVARWDHLDADSFSTLHEKFELNGYAVYAMLFPFERERFHQRIPGTWEEIGRAPPATLLRYQPNATPTVGGSAQ